MRWRSSREEAAGKAACQRFRGVVELVELMNCGVEKDDCLSDQETHDIVYSMHNTHTHTATWAGEVQTTTTTTTTRCYIEDVVGL